MCNCPVLRHAPKLNIHQLFELYDARSQPVFSCRTVNKLTKHSESGDWSGPQKRVVAICKRPALVCFLVAIVVVATVVVVLAVVVVLVVVVVVVVIVVVIVKVVVIVIVTVTIIAIATVIVRCFRLRLVDV